MTVPHSASPTVHALRVVLGAGVSRHDLRDELAARGYTLVHEQPRGGSRFLTWRFAGPRSLPPLASDDPTEELYYQEDHLLGQRLVWIPVGSEESIDAMLAWLRESFAAQSLPEVTRQAELAELPRERVKTLGAWVALVLGQGALDEAQRRFLRSRLTDEDPSVRQAALIAASYLDSADVTTLLAERRQDPVLAVEIQRQLALRDPVQPASDEEAQVQLEDAIAASPLDPELYLRHAQALATLGQPAFAIVEAQVGLALARRAGWPLHEIQTLTDSLRARVTPPSGNFVTFLAERLALLLAQQHPHAVVEVSEGLLPLFGAEPTRLPLLLASSLAHRTIGRSGLAATQLDAVLESLIAPAAANGQASTPQVVATLLFILAQLRQAEEQPAEAVAAAEHALVWLSAPPATGAPGTASSPLASAIAALLAGEPPPNRRTLLFFAVQTLAAAGDYPAALTRADLLSAQDPDAADVHVARALLLNRLGQAAAALQACAQAQAVLRPIDRLLEDEDPLALLMLQRALAHIGLGQSEAAARSLQAALRADPRSSQRIALEPTLAPLFRQFPELQQCMDEASPSLEEPDPRTSARQAAALCLQSLPPSSALYMLLHDFFAAVLAIVDEGPPPHQMPVAMGLLSSVESQLDVLFASGETAAHAPAVNAAIAEMAAALGL
jgi:tetratricopeptide (TPR) repeat protein